MGVARVLGGGDHHRERGGGSERGHVGAEDHVPGGAEIEVAPSPRAVALGQCSSARPSVTSRTGSLIAAAGSLLGSAPASAPSMLIPVDAPITVNALASDSLGSCQKWRGRVFTQAKKAYMLGGEGAGKGVAQDFPIPEGSSREYECECDTEAKTRELIQEQWIDDGSPPLGMDKLHRRGARTKTRVERAG